MFKETTSKNMDSLNINIRCNMNTGIEKYHDGFHIIVNGIDLLDSKSGLISKSYEEDVYFFSKNVFPDHLQLVSLIDDIQSGFYIGKKLHYPIAEVP